MFLERNGNDESGVVVSSYRVVLSVMMLDAGCWLLCWMMLSSRILQNNTITVLYPHTNLPQHQND